MTRIMLVEDHQIVREGLKKIISDEGDMVVAAEFANGAEAMAKIDSEDYDLVLLDLSLPGRSGMDVLKHIRGRKPDLPVLVISAYPEEDYGIRVLKAGAAGFLSKAGDASDVINAIRTVIRGGKYLSPALADKLIGAIGGSLDISLHQTLSNREYEVFRLIASGKTVTEISHEMALSVKTISTYKTRILEKMKLKNKTDLTRYAFEHGLFD